MRRWMIYTAIVLMLSAASYTYNEIIWKNNLPLNWSDFSSNTQSGHFDALTATAIYFSVTEKPYSFEIEAYSIFDKKESWVNPKRATKVLLAHEQLHFDIAEVWTRKLRARVSQLDEQSTEAFMQLYDEHLAGMASMQEQYDADTHHSTNAKAQQKWTVYVKKELDLLSQYQNAITIK